MINQLDSKSQLIYESLSNYSVQTITDETNFWMVRTKKGFFYREFITKQYIALAWNIIDSSTSMNDTKALSEYITQKYPEIKRPAFVINKCKNFISEIKEGDIILIPSQGTTMVTFARAGKYFEDDSQTYDKERLAILDIENGNSHINDVPCPYKKRRHIEVITTVASSTLNYHLFRAITNYHGISNLKDYASIILNHLYPCYAYNNNLYFTFNVRSDKDLPITEICSFMKSTSDIIIKGMGMPEDNVKTKINLNSPGDISIILLNAFDFLKDNWKFFVGAVVVIGGGSIKIGGVSIDSPSVLKTIKDVVTFKNSVALENDKHIENKDKHARALAEIKGIKLDNELKKLEIEEKKKALNAPNQSYISDNLMEQVSNFETVISTCESLDIGPTSDVFDNDSEDIQTDNEEEQQ